MKRITAIALLAAAGMLGAGNALAQGYAVRATMPFDFTVGAKLLPAGTYQITRVRNDLITIQNSDKKIAILSTSLPDENQSANGPVLVFNKYGGEYFLRKVLGGSSGGLNINLPLTKSEERARKQEIMAHNQSQISIPASEGN
jgi:hypothetical protein